MADVEAPIGGYCDLAFERIKTAFEDNFRHRGELGAAVSVYYDGELVVDLFGGHRDLERTTPWTRDTLVCGFSLGKSFAAACVHLLVDRGLIDYDEPVARYWPEFGQAGKSAITVRQLLSHTAGLPGVRQKLVPGDEKNWERMTTALAEERPWWEPGSDHGYHVGTYGYLAGELVQRVSGRPFREFFKDELTGALELDAHFGLSGSDHDRVADFIQWEFDDMPTGGDPDEVDLLRAVYDNPWTMNGLNLETPGMADVPANDPGWRQAVIPSCNIHLTARAAARFCALHAGGGQLPGAARFMSRDVVEESVRGHVVGRDRVLKIPTAFALGFRRWQKERQLGPNPERSYFTHGFGGALALVDPDVPLAVGYVMNVPGRRSKWINKRNVALMEAAYEAASA